mgnify:CR=1 FL=1
MTPETCIKTTVSKMYDVVIFFELTSYYTPDDIAVQNPYINTFIRILDNKYAAGYVFMNLMPTSWTQLTTSISYEGCAGPYIEYNVAPNKYVKVRRNGLSIERYCTANDGNIDYQLLARNNTTYYVYGFMLEDHIAKLFK